MWGIFCDFFAIYSKLTNITNAIYYFAKIALASIIFGDTNKTGYPKLDSLTNMFYGLHLCLRSQEILISFEIFLHPSRYYGTTVLGVGEVSRQLA